MGALGMLMIGLSVVGYVAFGITVRCIWLRVISIYLSQAVTI